MAFYFTKLRAGFLYTITPKMYAITPFERGFMYAITIVQVGFMYAIMPQKKRK